MSEQVTQKLYVVLHGLIPVVEDQAGFHAILIEMDGHTMAAGHWLAETPLRKTGGARLALTGVEAGKAGISDELNLVVHLAELDLNRISHRSECYARIDLPKPAQCYSYFTGDAEGKLTGPQQPRATKYSAVQVFEYSVPGESFDMVSLSLGDKAVWVNSWYTLTPGGAKVSVLHIYNEPAGASTASHSAAEFLKGSHLFGIDVGLSAGRPLPFPSDEQPRQADLPPGLLVQELAPLGARDRAVFHLLDPLRGGARVSDGTPVGADLFCGFMHVLIGM